MGKRTKQMDRLGLNKSGRVKRHKQQPLLDTAAASSTRSPHRPCLSSCWTTLTSSV